MTGVFFMKKIVPFICSLTIGLFSGWFIECFLCFLSIMVSPFSDFEETKFLVFWGINSLLSAVIIIVVVIVDVIFLIELNSKKKSVFLIANACVAIFICLLSWYYAAQVSDVLYKSF